MGAGCPHGASIQPSVFSLLLGELEVAPDRHLQVKQQKDPLFGFVESAHSRSIDLWELHKRGLQAIQRGPPTRASLNQVRVLTRQETAARVFHLETLGCASNQADSEIMAGLLVDSGYVSEDEPSRALVLIVNTCYVKQPTEDRVVNRIKALRSSFPGKPFVVAGCMVEIDPRRLERIVPESCWVGPRRVDMIVEACDAAIAGRVVRFTGGRFLLKPSLPVAARSSVIDIVQIAEGCLGACSYCCTRFARGPLVSYPVEAIVSRVCESVSSGHEEIWMTAQDTAAYCAHGRQALPSLLKRVCSIPGRFLIRVGMMNPGTAERVLSSLVSAYGDEKVFKFVHLPVQSASDRILRMMRRRYTRETFDRVVASFRARIPGITLSTDVIVGFPGETPSDFAQTVSLIEETRPDILNVSRFFPRPGAEASALPRLGAEEMKARTRKLAELHRSIALESNERWVGWRGRAVVDERGKGRTWVCRNHAYKPIVVASPRPLLGRFVEVEVRDAKPTYLLGALAE